MTTKGRAASGFLAVWDGSACWRERGAVWLGRAVWVEKRVPRFARNDNKGCGGSQQGVADHNKGEGDVGCGRGVWCYGAPGRSRTSDLLVRSQLLYPAELRAHILLRTGGTGTSVTISEFAEQSNRCCGTRRKSDRSICGLVRPEGLEPPTLWFEAKCSIQLSYGRVGRRTSTTISELPAKDKRFGGTEKVRELGFGSLRGGWIGDGVGQGDERHLFDEVEAGAA